MTQRVLYYTHMRHIFVCRVIQNILVMLSTKAISVTLNHGFVTFGTAAFVVGVRL